MHRFSAICTFAIVVLAAGATHAQNGATASLTIPADRAPGGSGQGPAAAQPRPETPASINYETIHLDRRLVATRAISTIVLDGNLDEPAWNEAPIANGFIQNDPREGTPATYDTDVRVV